MIALALSGGVDSSLAGALLLESGRRVVGLHMDLGLAHGRAQAQAAADHLAISLEIVDLKEAVRQEVVEPFLDLYDQGLTPNPCVICNRRVKFKELLSRARALGAEGLATGHFARLDQTSCPPALLRGLEPGKEQSYFLARLDPSWLPRLHFPLGRLTKAQVRRLAVERGLPAVNRPESQEVCFLAGQNYRDFFKSRRQARPGPMVDQSGRVVGRHQGLFAYTVGQRRGLNLPAARPYYVLDLDGPGNRLVVGPEEALFRDQALVEDCSWLIDPQQFWPAGQAKEVEVQVRYRAQPLPARLEIGPKGRVRVIFSRPQRAVAPGQLAAFYQGNRVLGGGWLA
ncbi:MAG: tRNA 2-thiouridine(34) synthase MnmA [Deltaproteobacteria bacterium]|nr:tRNA 2-thiouridine(34) synthase MnmA [Deltaproteobacteria bacterium]